MDSYDIEVYIFCALLGYWIGGINPAFVISKLKGFDIRSRGSGNAGASNAAVLMGRRIGLACGIFDILKAFAAVEICMRLFWYYDGVGLIAGVCCILGHIFPLQLCFKGGKGLAALGGVAMAYNIKLFLLLLMIELVIVLVVDYIVAVPITGSIIFSVILSVNGGVLYGLLFLPVVLAIIWKHRENLQRIRYGIEARFSFLWNKENDRLRVENNWNKLTDAQKRTMKEVYK